MNKCLSIVFCLLIVLSCTGKKSFNEKSAKEYYAQLSEIQPNYETLENFLTKDFIYEDVIFKQEYASKEDFIKSLDKTDTAYHFSSKKLLKLDIITAINDSMVWVKGIHLPYRYGQNPVDSMKFISVLYFNKDGKIKRQEDWIDHSYEGILSMYQFRNSSF